ncbi:MAG: cobalamin-dependent protein [Deltaproteobacteria bacterium]|jgi:methylmalonyl-CoA mutase C-terminal domain/subunit|nr:cobalamin-dependent protein [Deltaproteobacteria bacterium]
METKKIIRVLIAKIGLDGHDVGAKVLIYWLRDQGMEVIYTGLRQSVEQVVEVALQEAVDVIGVSILSGSHVEIARKLMTKIRERKLDDVLVLFGGTIPKDDIALLKNEGVQGVFPSHSKLEDISTFIKNNVKLAGA